MTPGERRLLFLTYAVAACYVALLIVALLWSVFEFAREDKNGVSRTYTLYTYPYL